jgi:hypothetical protein
MRRLLLSLDQLQLALAASSGLQVVSRALAASIPSGRVFVGWLWTWLWAN